MPGQVYATDTLGGNFSLPYLTERLRHIAQPEFKFRQFIDAMEAVGSGNGDEFHFSKTQNVTTQGGTLVETNTIPRTNFTSNNGTGTIIEYGNSVPTTQKLEHLSQHDVSSTVEMKLKDDAVKVLESAAGDQFVATEFVGVCVSTASTAITTDGTATATATADMSASNTRAFANFLKRRNVPKYDGSNYVYIGSVNSIAGMHSDTAAGGWNDISKYTGEFARSLHNGEVGNYYGVRFIEEAGGYFSDEIGNGSTRGQGVMFGSDYVYEATSIAEEIRFEDADFGRSRALAWYALLGFQIVWDFAVDSEQHGLFVTSA